VANRIEIVPYANPANGLEVFRLTDVATGTTVMQMRREGLRELVERAKAGEFDDWVREEPGDVCGEAGVGD
jgi:hypothetical protein